MFLSKIGRNRLKKCPKPAQIGAKTGKIKPLSPGVYNYLQAYFTRST